MNSRNNVTNTAEIDKIIAVPQEDTSLTVSPSYDSLSKGSPGIQNDANSGETLERLEMMQYQIPCTEQDDRDEEARRIETMRKIEAYRKMTLEENRRTQRRKRRNMNGKRQKYQSPAKKNCKGSTDSRSKKAINKSAERPTEKIVDESSESDESTSPTITTPYDSITSNFVLCLRVTEEEGLEDLARMRGNYRNLRCKYRR